MQRLLFGAALALALAATWAEAATVPPIMPVYGVKAAADGVTIRVPPLGLAKCTPTRRMLTMAVDKAAAGATLLVALAANPECRASGGPADVYWSYQELGLKPDQPFRFANTLVAEAGS